MGSRLLIIAYIEFGNIILTTLWSTSLMVDAPRLSQSCKENVPYPLIIINSGIFRISLVMWICSAKASLDFFLFINPTIYVLNLPFRQEFWEFLFILFFFISLIYFCSTFFSFIYYVILIEDNKYISQTTLKISTK